MTDYIPSMLSDSPREKCLSDQNDDLSCPVCRDIFRDPVVLSCSHSFCKACLRNWWTEKRIQECPVCKRTPSRSDPTCNLVLKKLCDSVLQRGQRRSSAVSETLCSLHGENLNLFCVDHQRPVCVVCLHSDEHSRHKFKPINEVASVNRAHLQKSLKPLKEKLKLFQQVKENYEKTAEHIKVQAQTTRRQIKEQFQRLCQFLQKEEENRRVRRLQIRLRL